MKGLILSGGKGVRLRPITFTQAKQLVPVANKPVLFYGLEAIVEAGITDIGIVVGDTKEDIIEAVGDGSKWGVQITYIEQPEPLGLAHAVLTSEAFLGKERFVLYLGDNLLTGGITYLVEQFQSENPNCQILLSPVEHPERFGVAELKGERVVRLVEKPKERISDLALTGIYMFDHNILDAARNIKPSARNELEITDAIQYLIDKGYRVTHNIVKGWWKDTGKLEDILEANRTVLDTINHNIECTIEGECSIEGKVEIGADTVIKDSVIRGPSIIGQGNRIIHSYIGPYTAIHDNIEIRNSEVENSIILEGSSIIDINNRINGSLIGKNVKIFQAPSKPKGFRFMLGDRSEVGICDK